MPDRSHFLSHPGLPGPFGALMDEYARAAEEFCAVVDAVPADRFLREIESRDPDTVSIRSLCTHVIGAAHRYADYIRKARGLSHVERYLFDAERLAAPGDVRPALVESILYTEGALDGLYQADNETVAAIRFPVRWGPIYDPEMILEHAIVHLLRHRRQIQRWPAGSTRSKDGL